MMRKIIVLFLISGMIIGCQTGSVKAASKKSYIQTGVKNKETILCKNTLNLKAKTVNTKKKITYKSSKASVASVNARGIVKGRKYGTAVISLKAKGLPTKKVTIYVRKPVTSIKLESNAIVKLKKGEISRILVKVLPGGKRMINTKLSYESSNTKIAIVSSKGIIKARNGGYTKITIFTPEGLGKIIKKYVDVFIYEGFDQVCTEISENKTMFTLNPNWKSIMVNFKAKNGKIYSKKMIGIRNIFELLNQLEIGSGFGENGIYIEKMGKNEIRFKLLDTNESYDAKLDSKRYQLTFYKALNNKVTFNVEK